MSEDEPWQNLKEQFERALRNTSQTPEQLRDQIWRLLVGHPWYKNQLRLEAERAIRDSGLPMDWRGDVEHDAMVLLARKLQAHPDLHMDAHLAKDHFPGWMATIIRRDCLLAIRRLRTSSIRTVELRNVDLPARRKDVDACIDLAFGMEQLSPPEKQVLMLRISGMTVKEISLVIGAGYSRTRRILLRTQVLIRRFLH